MDGQLSGGVRGDGQGWPWRVAKASEVTTDMTSACRRHVTRSFQGHMVPPTVVPPDRMR